MSDEMDKMMGKTLTMAYTMGTIATIMEAIKRNGLEKTVEDLQGVYKIPPMVPKPGESEWQSMLEVMRTAKKLGDTAEEML